MAWSGWYASGPHNIMKNQIFHSRQYAYPTNPLTRSLEKHISNVRFTPQRIDGKPISRRAVKKNRGMK